MDSRPRRTGALLVPVLVGLVGVFLRLFARSISWPQYYTIGGDNVPTSWTVLEEAVIDVARVLMLLGVGMAIVSWHHALNACAREGGGKNV